MRISLKHIFLAIIVSLSLSSANETKLRIITNRAQADIAPLAKMFEQANNISVELLYVDSGIVTRLENTPTEADLVVTETVDFIEKAKIKNLISPYNSDLLSSTLQAQFRDSASSYIMPSYKALTVQYSTERVQVEELSSYEDLADSKWNGRITMRSGFSDDYISLFCQMAEVKGMEKTKAFIKGILTNLAIVPEGSEDAQLIAIEEGKADITVGKSYSMGVAINRDDLKEKAKATELFFPNQDANGAFVVYTGAALTTANNNVEIATKFLEFLVGYDAQNYIVNGIFTYPEESLMALPEIDVKAADDKETAVVSTIKADFISPEKAYKHRNEIIAYLNEINFDMK